MVRRMFRASARAGSGSPPALVTRIACAAMAESVIDSAGDGGIDMTVDSQRLRARRLRPASRREDGQQRQ